MTPGQQITGHFLKSSFSGIVAKSPDDGSFPNVQRGKEMETWVEMTPWSC